MSRNTTVLYTTRAHTAGSRKSGVARSSDGVLDIRLAMPGSATIGAGPEQLLAAGWSASLLTSVTLEACKNDIALPGGVGVDAEIDLCRADGTRVLRARFNIGLPGVERGVARALVAKAFELCPYCRATRGNLEVAVELAQQA